MRTIEQMMQKFAEGHTLRPPYIAARGGASEEVLLQLVSFRYFLVSPASVGDGTFCTRPASGSSEPYCLFENAGLVDLRQRAG